MRGTTKAIALGLCFTLWSVSADLARGDANYGTFSPSFFQYRNVSETDTQTPGPNPSYLFGTPSLVSGSLNFGSTGFSVSSSGGAGSQSQDGQLDINFVSDSSSIGLNSVLFNEGGNWSITNGGSNTTVGAQINVVGIYITALNGSNLLSPMLVPESGISTFGTNVGLAYVGTGLTNITMSALEPGLSTGTWSITGGFSIQLYLQDNGFGSDVATGLTLSLDDVLSAQTDAANASDNITKTYFDITGVPTSPEPAGLSFIAGAALLALRRRRA
jgi:hypothetical protein